MEDATKKRLRFAIKALKFFFRAFFSRHFPAFFKVNHRFSTIELVDVVGKVVAEKEAE